MGSLLSEEISAFPMLPECTFITRLIRQFHDIIEYADRPRFQAYAKTKQDLVNVFAPAIHGFVGNALSHFPHLDAEQLVLKDPELTLYLDCLPDFFEDFKAVCVVRDPRKVIASMRTVFEKQGRQLKFEDLVGLMFNYYWRASESRLAKSGAVHFVHFDKILNNDPVEFNALESFLGYRVGRRGFGKTFFGLDQNDATYSDNYGRPMEARTESSYALSSQESLRVQEVFSGYNGTFRWW